MDQESGSGPRIAPRPFSQPSDLSLDAGEVVQADSGRNEKRKKITSACQLCQRRKVRCNGNQPCSTCVKLESLCTYARELDGRVGLFKRKFHEVQSDQTLLNQLLEIIREARGEQVFQVVSLIRRQVPLEDVRAYITEQLVEMQPLGCEPNLESQRPPRGPDQFSFEDDRRDGRPSFPRSNMLQITRLVDQPMHRMRAKPWTNVTDDDELVSHLISTWLTWDLCWFECMNIGYFLRDMRQGSLNAQFCSPFLVNCVLAWACPFSEYKETRSSNGETSPLVRQFVNEARRLLEHEILQEPSLPTVQGLMFLFAVFAVSGDFNMSQQYVLLTISLLKRLITSHRQLEKASGFKTEDSTLEATKKAQWMLYIITTETCVAQRKPQLMEVPGPPFVSRSFLSPFVDDATPSYPEIHSHRALVEEVFSLECELIVQKAEVSQIFFSFDNPSSRRIQEQRGLHVYHAIMFRMTQYPARMNPEVGSPQGVLVLRARTLSCILRLLVELRTPATDASLEVIEFAYARCVDTAIEVVRILRLSICSWGLSRAMPGFSLALGLSLTIFLETPDPLRYLTEISDICATIRALSRRWPMHTAILEAIQAGIERKGITVPPSVKAIIVGASGPLSDPSQAEQRCDDESFTPTARHGRSPPPLGLCNDLIRLFTQ